MFKELVARLKEGYRTSPFPKVEPTLSDRFRGRPEIKFEKCPAGCRVCADTCPVGAIDCGNGGVKLDMGQCLFCGECAKTCPQEAITFTKDFRLAAWDRNDLIIKAGPSAPKAIPNEPRFELFQRSLKLRQVSASGCNACEADINVLSTIAFDLGRFGIQVVASPRHADGILITGPVSQNMKLALEKTYKAVPPPRVVIVVGACAISGGPFIGHKETCEGAAVVVPVDLWVPGCPPHPMTILEALIRFMKL